MRIFDRPLSARKAIAYNAGIMKDSYIELVNDPSVKVLCVLARNPVAILFKEVYEKLMVHPDDDVRVAVASNFAIPAEAAIHLSTDKSIAVRLELSANSSIPELAMMVLAENQYCEEDYHLYDSYGYAYDVIDSLASNESITVLVMEKISEKFSAKAACIISAHKDINDKIAISLLNNLYKCDVNDFSAVLANNMSISELVMLKIVEEGTDNAIKILAGNTSITNNVIVAINQRENSHE